MTVICYACAHRWAHQIVPVHVIVPEPTDADRRLVEVIHDRKLARTMGDNFPIRKEGK